MKRLPITASGARKALSASALLVNCTNALFAAGSIYSEVN